MPQPWYRKFQKPTQPSSNTPWVRYTAPPASRKSTKIDLASAKEKAKRARYTGPTYVPTTRGGALGVPPGTSKQAVQAALQRQAMAAGQGPVAMPGGTTPAQGKVKLATWSAAQKKRAEAAGLAAAQAAAQAQVPTAPQHAGLLPSWLERFYFFNKMGTGATVPVETTPAPTTTPEYSSEGYGGYGGYGYGNGGGGGGYNVNYNYPRTQQKIAPLYATSAPDVPGWLQSLITWNIGG